jgi:hypothetical protein
MIDIGLSEDNVWATIAKNYPILPRLYLYNCMACIYGNSIGNASINDLTGAFILPYAVFRSYRFYQGKTLNNTNLSNSRAYWGFNSGS